MTKKEAIVKYISEMNIDMLSLVLENDISFMNLHKCDFLEKLQEKFLEFNKKSITSFSNVIPGICEEDSETNGLEGYKFISSDKKSLTLLFEEKNNDVIEIYNCDKFRTYQECEETESLHISVFLEEKIGYIPTFEHIILTNEIEVLNAQYEKFKNKITLIEEVNAWYNSIKKLYDTINVVKHLRYRFYYDFSHLVVGNMFVNFIVEIGDISKQALKDYEKINVKNEDEVSKWLSKYRDVRSIFSEDLKKHNDSENLIIHKEEESIILDCTNYRSSFEFEEKYNKHYKSK